MYTMPSLSESLRNARPSSVSEAKIATTTIVSRTAVPISAESEVEEAGLAEQLARTGAVCEAVEARADQRAPREPAEHDRRQQPDDEQQQGARDTREERRRAHPRPPDDGGDHGRPLPAAAAYRARERGGDPATRPPIARIGTATARCRRARSTARW